MESKYLNDFMMLFGAINSALDLIRGELPDRFIESCESNVNEVAGKAHSLLAIPRTNTLFFDAMNEIESNMYQCNQDNRVIYIGKILRKFYDIEPYLNIGKNRLYICDDAELEVGVTKYGNNCKVCNDILKRYCRWIEPEIDYRQTSNCERYIIDCFEVYNDFLIGLDRLCLDFGLDIMDIQRTKQIDIYKRESCDLFDFGYNKLVYEGNTSIKQPQQLQNNSDADTNEPQKIQLPESLIKWLQETTVPGGNNKQFMEESGYEGKWKWLQNKQTARVLLTHENIRGELGVKEAAGQASLLFIYTGNKPLELGNNDNRQNNNYTRELLKKLEELKKTRPF